MGTIQWMAPEILSSRPKYTKAADIYAYAMVLWELSSREFPFKGAESALVVADVKAGERGDIPENCPPKGASLIKFCWMQEPKQRPSAQQVADFLQSDAEKFDFVPEVAAPAASSAAPSYRGNFDSMRP